MKSLDRLSNRILQLWNKEKDNWTGSPSGRVCPYEWDAWMSMKKIWHDVNRYIPEEEIRKTLDKLRHAGYLDITSEEGGMQYRLTDEGLEYLMEHNEKGERYVF